MSEGSPVKLEKDLYQAIILFKASVNGGFPPAFRELGKLYLKGIGVKRDLSKAVKLFRGAAGKGDAEGMFILADYYLCNNDKDYEKILGLLLSSAKKGNIQAIECLADLYESGRGVKKNFKRALRFYTKAASEGRTISELKLGDYNYYGIGKESDIWAAKYWYRKAAEKMIHMRSLCLELLQTRELENR